MNPENMTVEQLQALLATLSTDSVCVRTYYEYIQNLIDWKTANP